MGADGFDAGSIFVSLRAQLTDFNSGISEAKKTLSSLTTASEEVTVAFQELDTAVVVFQEIEQSSDQAAQSFDRLNSRVESVGLGVQQAVRFFEALNTETNRLSLNIRTTGDDVSITAKSIEAADQKTNTHVGTLGRYTNRLLGVQIALLSIAQTGTGPLKDALLAVTNGVSTAIAAFQALNAIKPGLLSGAGAGVIGVAALAVSAFTRYIEESIKATDAMTDQEEKMRIRTDALTVSLVDAKKTISVFGGTAADVLVSQLSLTESAFAANLKRIREISDEIRKLKSDTGIYSPDHTGAINALEQERGNLSRQNADIFKTGAFDKANAEVAKMLQSTKDLATELDNVGIKGKTAIDFGIAEPSQVASENLKEARNYFEKLLDDNVKIVDESNKYNVSLEQRAEILKKLHPLDQIQAAANDVKAKKLIDDQIKAVNDLATTFSSAVGNGLRDAILNAKKPMEAIAGIGQNLFANMIDQTVKRLETGLTEAFKAITGAAGEGIGLALTGILGAAGAILSKLGSKGTDSFGSVQSAVTSTQAVRGVVAGPSSVAIATVGDNLSRAVAPLVTLQSAANAWLQKIEQNTRGGGRGGPGSSNVATATA